MASLLKAVEGEKKIYWDRRILPTYEDAVRALEGSTTVYIGNLAWMTQELQIHATFSTCGVVKSVVMGLNRVNKMPCGFCFVEFFTHRAATESVELLHGTKIEGRQIKVELDPGFTEGRQYGRGKTGGQVADHSRKGYDAGRGGWSVQGNERQQMQQQHRGGEYGGHGGHGGRGRFGGRGGGRGGRGGRRDGGGRRPQHNNHNHRQQYHNRRGGGGGRGGRGGRGRYDHGGVGGNYGNASPALTGYDNNGGRNDYGSGGYEETGRKRKRDRYKDDHSDDDERDDLDERDDRRPNAK